MATWFVNMACRSHSEFCSEKKLSVVSCQLPEKKKGSFFARISPALATNNWQLATRLFHRFG